MATRGGGGSKKGGKAAGASSRSSGARATARKKPTGGRGAASRAPSKKRASTTRAPSKAPSKQPRSRSKGGGRSPKGAPARPLWRRIVGGLARLLTLLVLGIGIGGSLVIWVMYRQALADVEALLTGEVWAKTGRVMSAPVDVWVGLSLTPEALAADLQSAGYARVTTAERPGDFQVGPSDVLIHVAAADSFAGKIAAGEVLVGFANGRVQSISPTRRLTFAPVELAGVRGPDNESRRPVELSDLPAHVPQAVLAVEDARFYSHEGLDPLGIGRAVLVNLVSDGPMQGGSTLTQQVVKNLFLTQERTYERKAREALLAVALEQSRSKDDILSLYLNEIYLGQAGGAAVCGVDQAARVYFGKPAERLTVGEAATLAGIVSAPNRYSPLRHPERAQERRDIALGRMVSAGLLDAASARAETAQALVVHPTVSGKGGSWVVGAAVDAVEASLGEGSIAARGITVHTTVQPALQRLGEQLVAEGLRDLAKSHPRTSGAQMALAAVRVSDGAVVALVGGSGSGAGQFNRAMNGRRQIGSTVKPLSFLYAFEQDPALSPSTLIPDEPIERVVGGKSWTPKNYDGTYLGEVTARDALAHSRNIPAIHIAEAVGMDTLAQRWRQLGLSGATARPSAALGAFEGSPLELAGAYTVFPGQGLWSRPSLVRGASDGDGKTLWNEDPIRARRSSARAAFLATTLMEAVMTDGTGRGAARHGLTHGVAGKTGTTDAAHDAWFVGFSGDIAVAVWVGFDKGKDLGLSGAQAALPTWSKFMAASGLVGGAFPAPDGLEQAQVCVESWAPADNACPETVASWFTDGTVPRGGCPLHGGPLDEVGDAVGGAVDRIKDRLGVGDAPRRRLFGRRRGE